MKAKKKMPTYPGGGMMKKMMEYAKGGELKEVPSDAKGLSKLPTAVRNKMGYMEKGGKMAKKVMIPAPKGHHWMNEGGRFYLMAHEGKFVPHEGAMLEAPFELKEAHSSK